MIRKANPTLAILILFSASSCLKEIPVPPKQPGEAITVKLGLGTTYQNQVFYDLENESIVAIKDKDAWDIAFFGNDTSDLLLLNSAKIMGAVHFPQASLTDQLNVPNTAWKYEPPEGDYSQSPLHDWENKTGIFVINAGMNHLGQPQGIYRIKPERTGTGVRIEWMKNGENILREIHIPKQPNFNHYGFSFATNELVETQPEKHLWDLKFSVYTHLFEGHEPYSVVGVLLNPNRSYAQRTTLDFNDVTLELAQTTPLEYALNIIGYDWKTYSFEQSLFITHSELTYLIQSRNNLLFKLRFIDFYNEVGVKGYPTFEFTEL
jgi:hypothetical protein